MAKLYFTVCAGTKHIFFAAHIIHQSLTNPFYIDKISRELKG
jgi:hypothetical protein